MPAMKWNLGQILEREGISAYRLHKTMEELDDREGPAVSRTTVYRWVHELPQTLDISLLTTLVAALRKITGRDLSLCEVLEYQE
jgi:hypothetical protein